MRNRRPSSLLPPRPALWWAGPVLALAAAYNILWGAVVVLFPVWTLETAGIHGASHPAIWQCVGMIVGVYGVGYGIAATDPLRHWPIVLVGLMGKVFGPIGFVWTASLGQMPWSLAPVIVFNDLVWWVPFALILRRVLEDHLRRRAAGDAGATGDAGG